jgi:flagellar protein FlaG
MKINAINTGGKSITPSHEVLPNNLGNRSETSIQSQGECVYSKEQLEREIENLNKFVQTSQTHLKFTLHEVLNEYYVQIVDDQTNEVIREVPSKKILDMVAKFHELIGLLIDEKR